MAEWPPIPRHYQMPDGSSGVLFHTREEVMKMSDDKVKLPDPGTEVSEATQNFLDKWTKRYSHTVVGKVLSFFGFGK